MMSINSFGVHIGEGFRHQLWLEYWLNIWLLFGFRTEVKQSVNVLKRNSMSQKYSERNSDNKTQIETNNSIGFRHSNDSIDDSTDTHLTHCYWLTLSDGYRDRRNACVVCDNTNHNSRLVPELSPSVKWFKTFCDEIRKRIIVLWTESKSVGTASTWGPMGRSEEHGFTTTPISATRIVTRIIRTSGRPPTVQWVCVLEVMSHKH